MIWRSVKSKVKISVVNSIAHKVQHRITTAIEELAECQTKRDEYQKQGQELRAQLDKMLGKN